MADAVPTPRTDPRRGACLTDLRHVRQGDLAVAFTGGNLAGGTESNKPAPLMSHDVGTLLGRQKALRHSIVVWTLIASHRTEDAMRHLSIAIVTPAVLLVSVALSDFAGAADLRPQPPGYKPPPSSYDFPPDRGAPPQAYGLPPPAHRSPPAYGPRTDYGSPPEYGPPPRPYASPSYRIPYATAPARPNM